MKNASLTSSISWGFFVLFCFCSFVFLPFLGLREARGLMGAVATGLHHSHSNAVSEPRLQPAPQVTTTLDPSPTEQGRGWNPQPHGSWSDLFTTAPRQELLLGVLVLQKSSKILLSLFLGGEPGPAPRQHYCFLAAAPWSLHPLPSLIGN